MRPWFANSLQSFEPQLIGRSRSIEQKAWPPSNRQVMDHWHSQHGVFRPPGAMPDTTPQVWCQSILTWESYVVCLNLSLSDYGHEGCLYAIHCWEIFAPPRTATKNFEYCWRKNVNSERHLLFFARIDSPPYPTATQQLPVHFLAENKPLSLGAAIHDDILSPWLVGAQQPSWNARLHSIC